MRNEEATEEPAPVDPEAAAVRAPLPAPEPPLLILAGGGDVVCVDDLCLPPDARS